MSNIQKKSSFKNSLDMKMLKVEPGGFEMGREKGGNWDERPVHQVEISYPFYVSQQVVTEKQFKQFQPEGKGTPEFIPEMSGISWEQAMEFCEWLTEKEGRPYRLPTEAEWEYICKKGLEDSSSYKNKWGVQNLLTGVREWCYDWYGDYRAEKQVDPLGPDWGISRVVRGGGLDELTFQEEKKKIYSRPSNRASMAPAFGHRKEDKNNFGYHCIGFRIVQAPLPKTKPYSYKSSNIQKGVKQKKVMLNKGPDENKPYIKRRYMLPTPPENCSDEDIEAAGLHSAFRGHNHSPGMTVCPNGDILLIIYSSYHEYEPEVTLIASRLRHGAEQWDMPDVLFNFADTNNHAPLLWTDQEKLHFFWGNPRLENAFPFQWVTSKNNGAEWGEVKYPDFENKVGEFAAQPINTAFRDKNDNMYLASDARGASSVLWISKNDGQTWIDPGGRTRGRHTTFALLKNGDILGMGGKNSDIDKFMPQFISKDQAQTWKEEKTQFSCQGSGQRPSILRLQSGRLFFAADFQNIKHNIQPDSIKEKGAFVALSEDEGETWNVKKLPGTKPKKQIGEGPGTIGYSVARQAPNGLIHLITSNCDPCMHFTLNEAWILSAETGGESEKELLKTDARKMHSVENFEETYDNGSLKVQWSGGVANNGHFLLHGRENRYYRNGQKQWEINYELGRKTGKEIYYSPAGEKVWTKNHKKDQTIWTHWWPNGQKKIRTRWKNFRAEGRAVHWNKEGEVILEKEFEKGRLKR